jgi:hypothetical protein
MDYALKFRRAIIESASSRATEEQHLDATFDRYAESLKAKRIRAINWLASMWVLHDKYSAECHPHHNSGVKHSVTLSKFLHDRGAVEAGRV